jgi:uncharacterized protein (DUF2141 family)
MIWLLTALLLSPSVEDSLPVEEGCLLIVETLGYDSDDGTAVLGVFNSSGWVMPPRMDGAMVSDTIPIIGLAATFQVDSLPSGRYVAWVFQDLDADRTFDSEEEKSGMSAPDTPHVPPGQTSPGFEAMSFAVEGSATVVRITVREFSPGPPEGGPPDGGPGGAGGPPQDGSTPPWAQ